MIKSKETKKSISINDVPAPDLPVASYAASFRGNIIVVHIRTNNHFFSNFFYDLKPLDILLGPCINAATQRAN